MSLANATTLPSALAAHESLGIRYGTEGPTPGAFYDFPGDPLETGAGIPVTATTPDSSVPFSAATGPGAATMPIPVGAPATGGGSTSGGTHDGLLIGGGVALAGAAVAARMAARRSATVPPTSDSTVSGG